MLTSAQPRTHGCLCALLALLAALVPAAPAAAQLSAGRIVGTVTDPSKAAIPRATVVATDTATNVAGHRHHQRSRRLRRHPAQSRRLPA